MRPTLRALATMAAILAALQATPAKSQSTTTNCRRVGNEVTCNTGPTRPQTTAESISELSASIAAYKERKRQKEAEAVRAVEHDRLVREAASAELARAALQQQQMQIIRDEQARQRLADEDAARNVARDRDNMAQVSTAILEGRCNDAKKIALLWGRLDVADQAMRLCKDKPSISTKGASVVSAGTSNVPRASGSRQELRDLAANLVSRGANREHLLSRGIPPDIASEVLR